MENSNTRTAQIVSHFILNISAIFDALEMNGYSLNDLAVVRSHLSQLAIRQLPRFPGPEPDTKQRRNYVEGFLSQCFPRENTEDTKQLLRKDATIIAANLLIKGGTRTLSVSRFEWEADKVFWDLWFLGLPPQSKPAWPCLRHDHDRDGGLNINRASVPEERKYSQAPPQTEFTSIQVMEWNGIYYPLPAPVPALRGRRNAWASLYPGVTPPDPELPFTLILPSVFDFWTFVWGPDGRDFNKIRERLLEERVEVAWRYDERVEGIEVNVECPIDTENLPETAHALVVGPVLPQAVAHSGLPINSEGVGKVWADIRNWVFCLHLGPTEYNAELSGEHGRRKKRIRSAYDSRPSRWIQGDNRGITVRVCSVLRDWALSRKEGICLDVPERINLAAELWRNRALTPEMEFQISERIATMKRDVKAELLRNSMRM
ncbi:hypothetical protein FPHYL_7562 [Fusarium phyllophilum]|uniref:Uncharacterized protein n=1 Tax=Fusarium phyllophilum TaxID=47803 RepID=A0A8H5JM59_9HYPO|nr:hypothetical protein FPHYL_7562 [Fusarium phyllophilum]